jgi:peptide/nickel transport system substrate-binding protein
MATFKMRWRLSVVVASGLLVLAAPASAETLIIGWSAEPTSVDPHYHNYTPNNALAKHVFSSVVDQDAEQRLQPGLAEEWEPIDETTWEFRLRSDVTFSNGEPFTARDVVYTVCRIPMVPDAPSPFTLYTSAISDIEAPDDHTLVIRTDEPAPLLPGVVATAL